MTRVELLGTAEGRLRYIECQASAKNDMVREVARGLLGTPKSIPHVYVYDRRGSEIFEEICRMPEYYQTRTEKGILGQAVHELPKILEGEYRLVELGSGSPTKAKMLIEMLRRSQSTVEYIPVDVSEFIRKGAVSLVNEYPFLTVTGIIGTYEMGLEHINGAGGSANLIAWFGGSLGNLAPGEREEFLASIRNSMSARDMFMVGFDMVKDERILKSAYDDPQKITKRFTMNVLDRINREMNADFDTKSFEYSAAYDRDDRSVKMYLHSTRDQTVTVGSANMTISIKNGEAIHTETSRKFTERDIRHIVEGAGFEIKRTWQDQKGWFSLVLASVY